MSDKIIFYHGSFCIVQKPDLSRCAAGKDFGQGFYLTTSKIQTQKFVATSIKKVVTQKFLTTPPSKGYVNAFEYTPSDNLSLYEFKNADISLSATHFWTDRFRQGRRTRHQFSSTGKSHLPVVFSFDQGSRLSKISFSRRGSSPWKIRLNLPCACLRRCPSAN